MGHTFQKFERIGQLRLSRGKTREEIAAALGLRPAVLARYENGEQPYPTEIILALASYYGTSMDYLLGLTSDPVPYPPPEKE